MNNDPIRPFLDHQGVVILDGGLASELEVQGAVLDDELWSARLLQDDPDLLSRVHTLYLEAGADCIVGASYQATVEGFEAMGLEAGEGHRLLKRSMELALAARNAYWEKPENRDGRLRPLVAASIGPYGAILADGAEYTGRYRDMEVEALEDFHRDRLNILWECGADLVACETIPTANEVRALVNVLGGRPAWLSLSCPDGEHLADGSDPAELVASLAGAPGVLAWGVNCLAPSKVEGVLQRLATATDLPLAAYPNSGEGWDAEARCWTDAPEDLDMGITAQPWFEAGARLLGGCCRTGPRDIQRLRSALVA